jgi:diguanylate cyclase (GGDEF)-like protein
LRKANLILERLASSDSLTELANRRCFFERVADEIARANRYGHPLALQMLDIDRFKRINDRFGHAAGDAVLKSVAGILRTNLRQNDLAARIGGEEFVILLPVTTINDAAEHAERIRRAVETSTVAIGDSLLSVTVSIGVSGLDGDELSEDPMLTRADRALYQAKKNGRNQVQTEAGPQASAQLRLA